MYEDTSACMWTPICVFAVSVSGSDWIILSLDDSNWLHLKALSFLDLRSVGEDPRAIYYIRLKYVQSADCEDSVT